MPLFSNSAGFQVHGGTFYDVAGDVNLQFPQRYVLQDERLLRVQVSNGSAGRMDPALRAQEPRSTWHPPSRLPRAKGMQASRLIHESLHRKQPPTCDSEVLESRRNSGTHVATSFYPPPSMSPSPVSYLSFQAHVSENFPHTVSVTAGTVNVHPPADTGSGIRTLHRAVALEALYDSADSFPQPKCHPDTRLAMLEGLCDWATGAGTKSGRESRAFDAIYGWLPVPRYARLDSSKPILWLHGPFGAGKSAIMQTLCRQFQDSGRLGGSFVFRRGHPTCGNAQVLFATLAYQMALHDPELKGPISRVVEDDPSVMGRSIAAQVENLIIAPCRLLNSPTPRVLMIDGLDECDEPEVQQETLRLIRRIIRLVASLPLKIIIASRPEPDIREAFKKLIADGLCETLNIDQSFVDVRNFLRREFGRIHQSHRRAMAGIPTPWPSPDVLTTLIKKSSGYFIYPVTVVKIVDDKDARPVEQLQSILNPPLDHDFHSTSTHFEALDKLYLQVLSRVPCKSRPRLLDILSVVTAGFGLLPHHIEELLDLKCGDVQLTLRHLHSVLDVDDMRPVTATNASFLEFLQTEHRSAMFYVGGLQRRLNLARAVCKVFSCAQLHRDNVAWKLVDVWHVYCANLHVVPSRKDPDGVLCVHSTS